MEQRRSGFTSVDEYIASFPEEVQRRLRQMRAVIKEVAPDAEERIGYGMPMYVVNGPVVYFAAFKNHIGFYPAGSEVEPLKGEIARYRTSKGTLQFPLSEPLPLDLIRRVTEVRAAEDRAKPARKAPKKS